MPALATDDQVTPLSPEVSGRRASGLAYCQARKTVVGVPSGAVGGGDEVRTKPALGMPRLPAVGSIGPVRPMLTQPFNPPLVRAVPVLICEVYRRLRSSGSMATDVRLVIWRLPLSEVKR